MAARVPIALGNPGYNASKAGDPHAYLHVRPYQTPTSPIDPAASEDKSARLPTVKKGSHRGLWRRSVADPILDQLKQGISPEKIALTIAIGVMVGIFPVLGSTTIMCLAVGFALKLNQPILQLLNYLMYPAQVALILVFVRFGEWIFGAPPLPFSIPQMMERFRAGPARFFYEFAATFLHCIAAWLVVAPAAMTILYFTLLPILRAAARPVQR